MTTIIHVCYTGSYYSEYLGYGIKRYSSMYFIYTNISIFTVLCSYLNPISEYVNEFREIYLWH